MKPVNQAGSSAYRDDIDGLRAVAVLAVILFHVNPSWLPGGFVGVDVFFVISGYLITGIVARELAEGRFTFARFYERRIRRILPALWLLLAVCVPVSWLLMLPSDAEPMGKSAIWSTLAMANVYFWREVSTDYFAPQSAQLPFLHLWSLGVEEQFYLLWPVVLVAVWRLARHRAREVASGVAISVVLLSTLAGEWLLAIGETRFAYYMLPSRAGELALGAALALVPIASTARPVAQNTAHFIGAIGWALIGYSLVALGENEPFPGWRVLIPTVGAAALIASGQLAPLGKVVAPLRWKPALWLGRCSYSAYLWHWPILAWWRYLWGQPGAAEGLMLIILILALARTSQRLVEDPIRLSRSTLPRSILRIGLSPAILVVAMALIVARADRWGLPIYTESDRVAWAELEEVSQPAHRVGWVCQQHQLDPESLSDAKCEFGAGGAPARILLMGDSYAAQFAPLFRDAAEAQGLRIRSVALGACAPIDGPLRDVVPAARVGACEEGVPLILERAEDFPLLIVGAAWATYARNEPKVWQRLEDQLRGFVARGHRVWLLPKVPEFSDYDAACPSKRVRIGDLLDCPKRLAPRDGWNESNDRLSELARRIPGVRFLPLHELLCGPSSCPIVDENGHHLYADGSHLSVYGSRFLYSLLGQKNLMPVLAEPYLVDSSKF